MKQIWKWGWPVAVFAASLLISALLIAISGANPMQAMSAWFAGGLTDPGALAESTLRAIPLAICGLAIAVGLQAGVFNIGVEGQLLVGGLCAGMMGIAFPATPSWLHISLCIGAGVLGGAFWAWIPGILKAKRGAHEVITTIMFNYIALYGTHWLAGGILKDPSPANMAVQTAPIAKGAVLPLLIQDTRLHIGLFFALGICVLMWYLLYRTAWGFEFRATGTNEQAAAVAGADVKRMAWVSLTISGAIAGLAGCIEVLGIHHKFIDAFSPGYGFDGIAVALLGANHPFGVLVSGFVLGALHNGATTMQVVTTPQVPREISWIVEAVVIMMIAAIRAMRRGPANV
ncbi:MAG: ABC transporter permease [Armatimonadota bacterium]